MTLPKLVKIIFFLVGALTAVLALAHVAPQLLPDSIAGSQKASEKVLLPIGILLIAGSLAILFETFNMPAETKRRARRLRIVSGGLGAIGLSVVHDAALLLGLV